VLLDCMVGLAIHFIHSHIHCGGCDGCQRTACPRCDALCRSPPLLGSAVFGCWWLVVGRWSLACLS
jgi:hypothetical protein